MGAEEHELSAFQRLNQRLTRSWVGRYFECEKRSTTFFQEIRAGCVCFLTVCYIIPVNSGILTDTGGSCDPAVECLASNYANDGAACRFYDPQYAACQSEFKNSVIASTCIASMLATFLMSIFARMPLAVAPAMGVNAYFTYNVVGYLATKRVTYKQGLAAAFVEGFIFIFISLTGVRSRIVELIPKNIMYATAAGIGCFLAFVGLQQSEGVGLITADPATLVTLGGCPAGDRAYMLSIRKDELTYENICTPTNADGSWNSGALGSFSANYTCLGSQLRSATTWLGILGGGLMVLLMMRGVRASILLGILFITFVAWIPGHDASYFRAASPIPGGEDRYWYFRKGVRCPNTDRTGGKLDFTALNTSDVWVALITFLYLDFLDATSTMFAMARMVSEEVPGFVNERGMWPRQLQTMLVDGTAIVIGSLLGTSPLTVFAESAVGIREGGRTGITAFVVALGFGGSMFLSPIFASIPPYATGPAVILVGALMMEHSRYVAWDDIRQAVPAFLTIILMPMTYSIAYGVICGLSVQIFLWVFDTAWEVVLVLCGYYRGEKTLYHVLLDSCSHFYIAFNHEHILLRDLPGYKPSLGPHAPSASARDLKTVSGSGSGGSPAGDTSVQDPAAKEPIVKCAIDAKC